eukprot:867255-Lingulodinium_polyedra.AAC.1
MAPARSAATEAVAQARFFPPDAHNTRFSWHLKCPVEVIVFCRPVLTTCQQPHPTRCSAFWPAP